MIMKKAYNDPKMEIVSLVGEDIICASEGAADNDIKDSLYSDDTQSVSDNDVVEQQNVVDEKIRGAADCNRFGE